MLRKALKQAQPGLVVSTVMSSSIWFFHTERKKQIQQRNENAARLGQGNAQSTPFPSILKPHQ